MSGRLEGKVALVMGAGSVGPGWGNGRAIAVRFAQEGAKVFAIDRDMDRMLDTVRLVNEAGGEIETAVCDVTQSTAVAGVVTQCLARFGRIDVLVNNVGGSAAGGPVEMSEEVWDAQIDHNLKSVFLGCKHVLPVMEAQGSGAIVNISSTSGFRFTGSAQVAYASTKAGVIQFSRVVALQSGSTPSCPGSSTRRWSMCGWPNSVLAVTWLPCWRSGRRAFRCPSWATDATPPMPRCFWPRMKRGSSPAPS
jgi:NAD(P)-dependent dehydrogenase (short-subunit alcohol dehydrogenase family)